MLPTDEVIVLPINNTSVENLAAWFGRTLYERLVKEFPAAHLRILEVDVAETAGQYAIYRYEADAS